MTYKTSPVQGPFKGVISDLASLQTPPTAFDDILNYFVRKGRLQSRIQLQPFIGFDATKEWRHFGTFKDANGSFHSFGLADYVYPNAPAYMITAGPVVNSLANTASLLGPSGKGPFGVAYTQNQVYFSNGGYPVQYLDGSNQVQIAGDCPASAKFLSLNVNHLILANTVELTGGSGSPVLPFPRRIRWCASNNPYEWNPLLDNTAGFNDILDINNDLTGLTTISEWTYYWHQDGVGIMVPTGQVNSPYDFVSFESGVDGDGCIFPYALVRLSRNRVFTITLDDLCFFDGSSFQPCSGGNRKRIMNDLASVTPGSDFVQAFYLPNWGGGYDFPCILLTIPPLGISWLLTLDDMQWVRFSSSVGYVTAARGIYTT